MTRAVTVPSRIKGDCCARPIPYADTRVESAVEILRALADPTRLQTIGIMLESEDPICVCDLTATFDLSQPTISHHMARLKEAGLVEDVRNGIWAFYRLRPQQEARARAMLEVLLGHKPRARGRRSPAKSAHNGSTPASPLALDPVSGTA